MKKDDVLNKELHSREEEEEVIREYIKENTDIELDETDELVKNLDVKTILAFEEAMDNVAKEYERKKSKAEIFVSYIRNKNSVEEIVSLKEMKLNPPEGLEYSEIEQFIETIDKISEFKDIVVLEREKDTYLYDSNLWTGQYAITAILLKEKDTLEAIAQRTRNDCKIYPRPVQVTALEQPPYSYSEDEILGAIARMKFDERYSDIETVKASNGGICIYSSDHMSEQYARALCEELEVEWKIQQ